MNRLANTNAMLKRAQENHYAVAAFNIENMEMAQAVIAAAKETKKDVIIQISTKTLKYAPAGVYAAMINELCSDMDTEVALHLDHCTDKEVAAKTAERFSSIMIDASKCSLEENIDATNFVIAACHSNGVTVEAELGMVGGKEDDIVCDKNDIYAQVADCVRFINETGVDSLAVGIGTMHGVYKGEPNINVERLREIRAAVDTPLVLHGASGLSREIVRECISEGICKVNFATELRIAFTNAVKKYLDENENVIDPKSYLSKAYEAVKELAKEKIELCSME